MSTQYLWMFGLEVDWIQPEELEELKALEKLKKSINGRFQTAKTQAEQVYNQTVESLKQANPEAYKKVLRHIEDDTKVTKTDLGTNDHQVLAQLIKHKNTRENKLSTVKASFEEEYQTAKNNLEKRVQELSDAIEARKQIKLDESLAAAREQFEVLNKEIAALQALIVTEQQNLIDLKLYEPVDQAIIVRQHDKLDKYKHILQARADRRYRVIDSFNPVALLGEEDSEYSDGGYSDLDEDYPSVVFERRYKIRKSKKRIPKVVIADYTTVPTHASVPLREKLQREEELKAEQKLQEQLIQHINTPVKVTPAKQPQQLGDKPVLVQRVDKDLGTKVGANLGTVTMNTQIVGTAKQGWSIKDIPKFEGKLGEHPATHLTEFEDFLASTGVYLNIDPRTKRPPLHTDWVEVITRFKSSLKGKARMWYNTYLEEPGVILTEKDDWAKIKRDFMIYFNPLGGTREQQVKAWREMKWDATRESFDDFCLRFHQLAKELGLAADQQMVTFLLSLPSGMPVTLGLSQCKTIAEIIDAVRRGMVFGGVPTPTDPTLSSLKPAVPFMAAQDVGQGVFFKEPEVSQQQLAMQAKMGETLEQMNRLTQAVERFASKPQEESKGNWNQKNQNRSQEGKSRGQGGSRPQNRQGGYNGKGRGQQQSKMTGNCFYCKKPGHPMAKCFSLEKYLKKAGKEIRDVGNEDEGATGGGKPDVDVARMMQLMVKAQLNNQSSKN